MKLDKKVTYRREGRGGKRFYTQLDMAIIKREEAYLNAMEKSGRLKRKANRYIAVCGCGCEGCFIHSSYDNS